MPHSSTGMCIGSMILPPFGMEWNAIGRTRHSAMFTAVRTRRLVAVICVAFCTDRIPLIFGMLLVYNRKSLPASPTGIKFEGGGTGLCRRFPFSPLFREPCVKGQRDRDGLTVLHGEEEALAVIILPLDPRVVAHFDILPRGGIVGIGRPAVRADLLYHAADVEDARPPLRRGKREIGHARVVHARAE